jgi:membrane protease YdiL (CAAX protease family)
MDTIDEPVQKRSTWADRVQALLEVALVGGIVSSYIAFLPFYLRGGTEESLLQNVRLLAVMLLSEAAITVLLIALLLQLHRQTWRDLGWRLDRLKSNIGLGLAVVPLLFATNIVVAAFVRHYLPRFYTERNPLIEGIQTRADLALFLCAAVLAGGVKEELQRAFILGRFRGHLGGALPGLILWSAVFGAGHYIQGVQGAFAAGLFGLLFGIVYLARASLVPPMVAHTVYDVAALLGYWFFRTPANP